MAVPFAKQQQQSFMDNRVRWKRFFGFFGFVFPPRSHSLSLPYIRIAKQRRGKRRALIHEIYLGEMKKTQHIAALTTTDIAAERKKKSGEVVHVLPSSQHTMPLSKNRLKGSLFGLGEMAGSKREEAAWSWNSDKMRQSHAWSLVLSLKGTKFLTRRR